MGVMPGMGGEMVCELGLPLAGASSCWTSLGAPDVAHPWLEMGQPGLVLHITGILTSPLELSLAR